MDNKRKSEAGYHVNSHAIVTMDTNLLSSPLWTVEEVAGFLKLQPETIRSMARRGELPAIKIGKVWRFERASIQQLILNLSV